MQDRPLPGQRRLAKLCGLALNRKLGLVLRRDVSRTKTTFRTTETRKQWALELCGALTISTVFGPLSHSSMGPQTRGSHRMVRQMTRRIQYVVVLMKWLALATSLK